MSQGLAADVVVEVLLNNFMETHVEMLHHPPPIPLLHVLFFILHIIAYLSFSLFLSLCLSLSLSLGSPIFTECSVVKEFSECSGTPTLSGAALPLSPGSGHSQQGPE